MALFQKTSIKSSKIKNLYLSIIDFVRENKKLPSLDMSPSHRNYYIYRLKLDGILVKKGYGVWDINESVLIQKTSIKSSEVGQGVALNSKLIRGHGFNFTLRLPKIENWENREDFLKKCNFNYHKIPQGLSIKVKDYTVWLCEHSIVVYFPDYKHYWTYTAQDSKNNAVYDFLSIIRHLESVLKADLSIKGEYYYRTSRQHFAKVKDLLAKEYNSKGKNLEIKGKDGKTWLITDKSLNQDELEFIHNKSGVSDSDQVISPFLNDLKNHYDTTGETLLFTDLLKAIYGVSSSQKMMDTNIKTHFEVLNSIKEEIKNLSNVVSKIKE